MFVRLQWKKLRGCVLGFLVYQFEKLQLSEVSLGWFHWQSPSEISCMRDWDWVALNHSITYRKACFSLICFVERKFLFKCWKYISHVPRKFSSSGSENCVIVTFSHKSELMFEAVNDFIVIITESNDVFQRNSETECTSWVWIFNDEVMPHTKTQVICFVCCCMWIFEPKLVKADAKRRITPRNNKQFLMI